MRKRKLTPVRYRRRLLGHWDKNRRNSENWFGTVHASLYRDIDGDGDRGRGRMPGDDFQSYGAVDQPLSVAF